MKKLALLLLTILFVSAVYAESSKDSFLIHVKTDLSKDDAQICVAYNIIQGAVDQGYEVSVLIDASAVYTYKKKRGGMDKLSKYKIPDNLKRELSRQFNLSEENTPKTYGDYLKLLHKSGAKFYINGSMMVVSKLSREFGDKSKLSELAQHTFKVVSIKEMTQLIGRAKQYVAY